MHIPEPAKKGLIDEIRERVEHGDLSEFDHHRFEGMAKKEISRGKPENGYAALGILAYLRGDEKEMRANHEKALAASGYAAIQHYNYACSLGGRACLEEALEHSRLAFELDPVHVNALLILTKILFELRKIKELKERMADWNKMVKEDHPMAEEIAELYEDIEAAETAREEIARDGAIPLDEVLEEFDYAR